MGKSSNHRKENTFKFQTFSERIASISIDVIHQIKHHDDTPEESGTYFGEALEKQSELNFTDHFSNFRQEISEHVQTYAQLVHHEGEIVAALKKHLLVPDSMALPSLLDLVVQLARDLQTDFYRHFKDFFDILVQLLNRYTQDSEILESTFTSLSYIFKFLWRYLVKDIKLVYGYFSSLLSQQYKEYVRNFAAESFAFLMRKVKDPSALFDFMFTELQDDPDKSAGVGRLMFEMMKGVKNQLHSCSDKIFPLLLCKLGPEEKQSPEQLPWQLVETALENTMLAIAKHSDKEHLEAMWEILLKQLKTVHDAWAKETKKKPKQSLSECLERLVRLTSVWIRYRNGAVLGKPDSVAKILLEFLRGPKLPDMTGQEVLELTSTLLLTSYSHMTVEITRKLIPQVYKTEYPLEAVFSFTASLYQLTIFEKDVLPALLPFCQTAVSKDTKSCDLTLLHVTQMLIEKAPLPPDGSALEAFQTYMLDFGTRSVKNSFPEYVVSLLGITRFDEASDLAKHWATLVCLPHVRPLPDEKLVLKNLSDLVLSLKDVAETKDNDTKEGTLFVLCHAVVAMVIMLDNKEIFDMVPVELVITCLRRYPEDVHTLRMADIYFTHAVREEMLDILSLEMFSQIFTVLQHNLSSPHSQVRLLTLRIFSSFSLPIPETAVANKNMLDVFTICRNAEKTPATVHNYREKLMFLQKLEHNLVQSSIPPGPYHQVPLRYLIGCLFVNFKLLWEPVISLIASHAHNMDAASFWEVFSPALLLAAEKSEESLSYSSPTQEPSTSDTASSICDVFSHHLFITGTSNSRPDYTNFRFHLWKSMHNFPDKCEPKSREFVPLFFRFLKNEYYLTDLSVAPTQNLLKANSDSNVIDSLDEDMEIEEVEASNGENQELEQTGRKYDLRSQDSKEKSVKEVGSEETITRRIRTRSQCSNVSDMDELDSSLDNKVETKIVGKKGQKTEKVNDKAKQTLNGDGEKVTRRRTRSQCSSSDLEELSFDVKKKPGKRVLDKHVGKHEAPIIEEDILDSEDDIKKSAKENMTKKDKKKSKQKDKNVSDQEISETEKKSKKSNSSGKKRKAAKSSLIVQLELFSKFKNPRAVSMEPQLRDLYFELLIHKSADVQKVAFQCIMSYKYKYLTPYKENFDRLLEDKSFKEEIVLFSIDHENSVINSEHRADVLPVLMRILYGKMFTKTGKGTTGKQFSGIRQSIILRFLNGCRHTEIETFINLIFAPFQHLLGGSPDKMVCDIRENTDLTKVLPVRKLLGVLNSVNVIFKKLGHLMDNYLPKLIQIILGMATVCCVCLENRQKLIPQVINSLKTVRQLTIYRLIQVFNDYDKYDWKVQEVDAVFSAVVWPPLEKLPYEGIYHPTPLLKLFQCWSRNPRYCNLLAKHSETSPEITPLPYVLKLLLSKDASSSVKIFIMDMIDNLLLPVETDELNEIKVIDVNHMIKLKAIDTLDDKEIGVRLLLPHIPDILTYIQGTIDYLKTQLTKKQDSCKELNILSRISSFVQDSSQCASLISLLLPFLGRKTSRSQKTEEDILSSILNLIKLTENRTEFFSPVSRLFSSLTNTNSRAILCDVLQAICEGDDDLSSLAAIVSQLNSWDKRHMEEPDYMLRLEGFQAASSIVKQMVTMETETCLTLVYNCCFFITTVEDMSLRDNASHCLVTIVTQFSNAQYEQEHFNRIIAQGLLPEVKLGLRNKKEVVRHEFTTVLVSIVDTFGDKAGFSELKALRDKDVEADFYENIKHIQMHKRSRALRRLIKCLNSTRVRNDVILSYFLPMVSAFLTDDMYKKHSALLDAAVDAVGCLCQQLPWKHYLHQLKYYLNLLQRNLENQKLLVRVIVSILDAFHFDLSNSQLNMKLVPEATTEVTENKTQETEEEAETSEELNTESPELETSLPGDVVMETTEAIRESEEGKTLCSVKMATKIHKVILENVIRHLHKILVEKVKSEGEHKLAKSKFAEDDEILRVPIALAMVKLLQNLPKGALERYLPGVLLKVCNFLRSRATDIRNTARDTLVKIVTTLGTRYFPYILSELKGSLKRGYQRHVLCYTVYQLLKKMEDMIQPGDIDVCLKSLQEIFNEEVFGDVSDEKEVEGITAKVFEARSSKSYESYELMAKYISKRSLMTLVEPLKQILDTTHSHKSAKKVQDILKKIVMGLMDNKDITVETLLIFIHGLTTETLPSLSNKKETKTEKTEEQPGQKPQSCLILPQEAKRGGNKPKASKKTNIHVMVEFGLQILNQCLKRQKIAQTDKTHLEMLDPLVPMMAECLYSKYIRVNTFCLRGLCWILKFPLPSLEAQVTKIANGIFILLRNYATAGAAKGNNMELVSMLFKAVTVLVRDVKFYKIDLGQLQVLLTFCEEDLHDYNRQSTAFSLLKAILSRKLNFPEIHELMKKVQEMSITADSPHVRRECRQVTLQYLLDYPLGKKLQDHLVFYVTQLSYEMETGRESALEMMAAFFSTFPQELLSEKAGFFFVPMSASLVNDDSAKCRKLTALAIKSLLGKIDNNDRSSLFSIVIKWLMDEKLRHRTLAAQLCGLFVEVEGAKFQQRLEELLPVIEQQLEPGKYDKLARQSVEYNQDHMLYNMLNSLGKILRDCNQVIRNKKWRDNMNVIWEHVESHLSYPHIWVQLAACQLFGLLFAAWQPDQLIASETDASQEYLAIDTTSKMRTLAMDFVNQLQSELLNDDLASQIVKNMLFLAKVAKYLDSERSEEETEDVKPFSVVWMVRRMVREAHHEAIRNAKASLKRKSVYKWMAAVSLDLGETGLPSVLHIMVPPLQRDINDQSNTQDPTLKSLAQEVLDLLKKIVGLEKFTEVYASSQKIRAERKGERKRNRAFQAVANPEVAARKKIKKHLAKKEAKKRKMEERKPSKKAKRQKYQEFTVAD